MAPENNSPPNKAIYIVFVGLVAWAGLLAAGVMRQSSGDFRKALIIVGVVVAFLLLWTVMLVSKKKRPK